jgi:hypothetical protein
MSDTDITKHSGGTLADRLAKKLPYRGTSLDTPSGPPKGTLLLDTSGSMLDMAEPGLTKIEALNQVVKLLNPEACYEFDYTCRTAPKNTIFEASGSTNLLDALETVKADGLTEIVLVTDGEPTSDRDLTLAAAKKLKVEIVYVGPEPRPQFLDQLAAVCGTTIISASMKRKELKKLQRHIAGLLTASNG